MTFVQDYYRVFATVKRLEKKFKKKLNKVYSIYTIEYSTYNIIKNKKVAYLLIIYI